MHTANSNNHQRMDKLQQSFWKSFNKTSNMDKSTVIHSHQQLHQQKNPRSKWHQFRPKALRLLQGKLFRFRFGVFAEISKGWKVLALKLALHAEVHGPTWPERNLDFNQPKCGNDNFYQVKISILMALFTIVSWGVSNNHSTFFGIWTEMTIFNSFEEPSKLNIEKEHTTRKPTQNKEEVQTSRLTYLCPNDSQNGHFLVISWSFRSSADSKKCWGCHFASQSSTWHVGLCSHVPSRWTWTCLCPWESRREALEPLKPIAAKRWMSFKALRWKTCRKVLETPDKNWVTSCVAI